MPGTLFVVATPIGNLEDISARALRVLREVTLIAAEDTRRTAHLLARYAISTPTTSLHEHNEVGKSGTLVARLLNGDSIALVSDAGTPTISDPGMQLVKAAIESGVRIEAIPGASAALAILAVSGLPAEEFTFLGFPPIKANDRKSFFGELKSCRRTVVFFESPHRILFTLEQLKAEVGDVPLVVGRELTKAHEEVLRGSVSQVIDMIGVPRGEFVVAINIGQETEQIGREAPSDSQIVDEFGVMTSTRGFTRRQSIAEVSRRFGLPPNFVYKVIERHKKSVK
jgi:16S rRNA (cytidine1402-2'-O)-methyltransferase